MAKFKKRPVLIEATQWFHNGDHPQDEVAPIEAPGGPSRHSEGQVVRHFRSLNIPGDRICAACGNPMKLHGELFDPTKGSEDLVCPGDYIVTDSKGSYYRVSPQIFETMYEPYPGES